MTTEVRNLYTGEMRVYSCAPFQAVVSAYAQSKGDYNTWQYRERYWDNVDAGNVSFCCGDWAALRISSPCNIA